MSREDRVHERIAATIAVRFESAEHFVSEYAENLSVGGLFLRGGHTLEALSQVKLQVELPGFGDYQVTAQVAHVLDPETAKRFEREPGAGMQLIEVPPGFQDALTGYLAQLGRRRDCTVLVERDGCAKPVEAAGFLVQRIAIDSVTQSLMGATQVLALVVDKEGAGVYRDMISLAPQKPPVIGCSCPLDEKALLTELDRLVDLS